jgi:hypothetical protein
MIPKVNNSVNQLIFSMLKNNVFEKLNKSRKDFIVNVLWHILSIKGRINFLQLGRFSTLCQGKRDNEYQLSGQMELDYAFFTTEISQDQKDKPMKRGRGSQNKSKVLVMDESTFVDSQRMFVSPKV